MHRPTRLKKKYIKFNKIATCRRVDRRVKIKENEKRNKYSHIVREQKKLWNMKLTVIPVVIGALGTIPKGLIRDLEASEIGERAETIQTEELLRSDRILKRVMES